MKSILALMAYSIVFIGTSITIIATLMFMMTMLLFPGVYAEIVRMLVDML